MDTGESVVDLARTFGVDRATLYRLQAAGRPA
jgi:transposase-like protein